LKYLTLLFIVFSFSFPANAAEEKNASLLFEKVVEKYSQASTYSDTTEVLMYLLSQGIENKISYTSEIAIKKPDMFMVKNKAGLFGRHIVSNGEKIWVYFPLMKKYSVAEDSNKISEILSVDLNSLDTIGTEQFLLFSFFDRSSRFISKEKSEAEIAGEEEINGKLFHILKIKNEENSMMLWVDTCTLNIHQITVDMSPILEEQQDNMGIEASDVRMSYTEIHKNISVNNEIPDDFFVFKPPEGVTEVDSEGQTEGPGYSLIGKEFSLCKLDPLNSTEKIFIPARSNEAQVVSFINITSEDSGKIIEELKYLYKKYDGKVNLAVIGKNKNLKQLRKYLSRKNINFPVAVERQDALIEKYGITSFPTTLLIDKNGLIQQVYSGYFEGLAERLSEDFLILNDPEIPSIEDSYTKEKGFHLQWSLNLKTVGLDTDTEIVAVNTSGSIYHVNTRGSIDKVIELDNNAAEILYSDINEDNKYEYIVYGKWGKYISVYNSKGKLIWELPAEFGVLDVKNCELGGDNNMEIAVGMNGPEGIKVCDSEGNIIWTSTQVINVWNVSCCDINGDGVDELSVVSYDGKITLFDSRGTVLKKIEPEIKSDFAELALVSGRPFFLISGMLNDNEVFAMLDSEGEIKWEVILGNIRNAAVESLSINPLKEWIAIGTVDGQVFVFDDKGNNIAYKNQEGLNVKVSWIELEKGEYSLITASVEKGLNAYNITEENDFK